MEGEGAGLEKLFKPQFLQFAVMTVIREVKALEILDSRGNPTVQAIIRTSKGAAKASVPSGASTGIHEAHELRDGGNRYNGKGVLKAVANVNTKIAKALRGKSPANQKLIDTTLQSLDPSANKAKIGANAALAVSMAACRLGAGNRELFQHISNLARNRRIRLPVPQMNILDGGAHVGAEHDIQEYMIVPLKFKSFSEALRAGTEAYHIVKERIARKYGFAAASVTAEGGFIAPMDSVEKRLQFLLRCIDEAGYTGKIKIALDAAASEFYDKKSDCYRIGSKTYSSESLAQMYQDLIKKYPVISLEDGLAEDDWEGWSSLQAAIGKQVQIVGDDLLVTNPERIRTAIKKKAANALLLKPNQIGTVTEAIKASQLAKKAGWKVIASHRSGETEDSFIADLAVGIGADQVKFGAPARSDRTSKYNRLLEIESSLGKKARFGK